MKTQLINALGKSAEKQTNTGAKIFMAILAAGTTCVVAAAGAGAYAVKKIAEADANDEAVHDLTRRVSALEDIAEAGELIAGAQASIERAGEVIDVTPTRLRGGEA